MMHTKPVDSASPDKAVAPDKQVLPPQEISAAEASELHTLQIETGVRIPVVLLPSEKTDIEKWAVIACDQYTSEPGYWEKVRSLVGTRPSTLDMIYPEVYLSEGEPAGSKRIESINRAMREYLRNSIIEESAPGFVYTERAVSGGLAMRKGLLMAFDLDKYDFSPGSQSLIRATEGTVTDRLPPRVRIRRDALLELPHILILVDDPDNSVIGPVTQASACSGISKLYDFELMQGGGRIRAFHVAGEDMQLGILKALQKLAEPKNFKIKYNISEPANNNNNNNNSNSNNKNNNNNNNNNHSLSNCEDKDKGVLLFAVGDGNHSLATAKVCWEKIKKSLSSIEMETHPARFALAELVNIHDEGIIFEPIHRILYNAGMETLIAAASQYYTLKGMKAEILRCGREVQSYAQLQQVIHESLSRHPDKTHVIGMAASDGYYTMSVGNTPYNIESGTLQCFLDDFLRNAQDNNSCGASDFGSSSHQNKTSIDYVHGSESVDKISRLRGNIGFFLPVPSKGSLFKTVIHEGVLPRKSFSMGEAQDKRYYLECRKIVP